MATSTDAGVYWVAWIRQAHGLTASWRPLLACEDKDVCRDLIRHHCPRGCHVVVLQSGCRPPEILGEDFEE
jgi:hypothetical protein